MGFFFTLRNPLNCSKATRVHQGLTRRAAETSDSPTRATVVSDCRAHVEPISGLCGSVVGKFRSCELSSAAKALEQRPPQAPRLRSPPESRSLKYSGRAKEGRKSTSRASHSSSTSRHNDFTWTPLVKARKTLLGIAYELVTVQQSTPTSDKLDF